MPVFLETPLDGQGTLTNPFGIEWQHGGVDLAHFDGAPIYALVDGPLILHPQGSWGDGSYGNAVKQATGDGWFTLSAHLGRYASDVYDGQIVYAGKLVGYQGHTGLVRPAGLAGSHLHWGLCSVPWFPPFNADTAGYFDDPLKYLISEGDRMALWAKLEELEKFICGPGDPGGARVAAWVNGGNVGLLDCLGPQPAKFAEMVAQWDGIKEQTYGTNNLLHSWRAAAATQGITLP
ncbi:MAG: M23 family metallopeptidase [Pseudomonadales bacterium]